MTGWTASPGPPARAGDPRTLAQLRADVFTAVLAGNLFHTVPPTDPITRQADAEYPARPDPDQNRDGPVSRSGNGNPAEPDEGEPIGVATFGDAEPPDLDSRSETGNGGRGGATAGGRSEYRSENGKGGRGGATPGGRSESRSENGKAHPAAGGEGGGVGSESRFGNGNPGPATDPTPAGNRCVCGGIQPKFRRGVVDIQIKLSTLAELDNDPALIPGFGPVIADIARQVAHDQNANPAWKWSVTDDNGELLHHGHTRRRPNATEDAFVRARDRSCRAPGVRHEAPCIEGGARPPPLAVAAAGVKLGAA